MDGSDDEHECVDEHQLQRRLVAYGRVFELLHLLNLPNVKSYTAQNTHLLIVELHLFCHTRREPLHLPDHVLFQQAKSGLLAN